MTLDPIKFLDLGVKYGDETAIVAMSEMKRAFMAGIKIGIASKPWSSVAEAYWEKYLAAERGKSLALPDEK